MKETILLRNKSIIKEALNVDDFAIELIDGEINRLNGLTLNARHPFLFYSLLSLLTNIIFPIKGLKRSVRSCNDDFIFVSCPDSYFRTKTIDMIAGNLKYTIIYIPTFHIYSALRYYKFFKRTVINVYFPTIKFWYVLKAHRKIKKLFKSMEGIDSSMESLKTRSVLSSYLIYDYVAKDYISKVQSFSGKWVLEHQKFFFLPSVARLHAIGGKTVMLQHGVFFKPYYDFIPLVCDEVLCCSERERHIYIENGVKPESVITFGAPLQSLAPSPNNIGTTRHNETPYRLLIAMPLIDEKTQGLMQAMLEFIKCNYEGVLVRLRPRSREKDIEMLKKYLDGFVISEVGSTLFEDIEKCDKVISCSADANYDIMKSHKQFLYVRFDKEQPFVRQLNCVTEDNYKEEIRKLMESDYYSTFVEEQYKEIFGETDIDILRERFVKYIKE